MRTFVRLIGVAALIAICVVIFRAVRQYREDSVFDLGASGGSAPAGGSKHSISPELLAILADPGDKGPIELLTDGQGKEWLINRRNGYRYPVEDGIPIMLLEEGEKHKDDRLIAR